MHLRKWWSLCLSAVLIFSVFPSVGTGVARAQAAADVKTGDDEVLFEANFEDGVLGQWRPRASEKLDIVAQGHDSTRVH